MSNSSLKKLGLVVLAAVTIVFSAIAPASAATVDPATVTSSGAVSGATNPNPIVINATFPTGAAAKAIQIVLPAGWTWVTTMTYTSWGTSQGAVSSISGYTPTVSGNNSTQSPLAGSNSTLWLNSGGQMTANTAVTITISAGTVNVGAGTDFVVNSVTGVNPNSVIDTATVYLNGIGPTSTSTSSSSASASTASSLAATGSDTAPTLFAGVGFLAVGAIAIAGIQVARRRKNG